MSSAMWLAPLVAIVLTQVAALTTSVYLHRALAHRALAVHPLGDALFRAVLWLTTGQDRRQWVAVHRKHHAFTDRDGDPHSPRLLGFWRVQLLNVYYYAREARNPDTLRTFAPDIRADRLDMLLRVGGWDPCSARRCSACCSVSRRGCWRPASMPCCTSSSWRR
jgi:stearoyl-CoA desaturase (delta-9 desaturase)